MPPVHCFVVSSMRVRRGLKVADCGTACQQSCEEGVRACMCMCMRTCVCMQVRETPLFHIVNAKVLVASNKLDEARKVGWPACYAPAAHACCTALPCRTTKRHGCALMLLHLCLPACLERYRPCMQRVEDA